MHEAVALGPGGHVCSHLAGEDVAKDIECVMQGLVIDGLGQVLDEDVADARAASRGVTVGPHNAHGLAAQQLVVQLINGPLRCARKAAQPKLDRAIEILYTCRP